MYVSKSYMTQIKIDLPNGLWVFDSESATGKTRLFSCLRDLCLLGEPVVSFTYSDFALGLDLDKVLTSAPRGTKVIIILDRYDMYADKGHDAISEWAKHAIVLLDCKQGYPASADDNICFIEMTEDSIEVHS